MTYRRSPWYRRHSRWIVVAGCLVALILIRISYDWIRTDIRPNRNVVLQDGEYRVLSLKDPITFICQGTIENSFPIVVRLTGVQLPDRNLPGFSNRMKLAEQLSLDFVESNLVTLRFDRQRFDIDESALAFVLVGDEILNVDLLRANLVDYRPVPGIPSKLQRKLNKAVQTKIDHRNQ